MYDISEVGVGVVGWVVPWLLIIVCPRSFPMCLGNNVNLDSTVSLLIFKWLDMAKQYGIFLIF